MTRTHCPWNVCALLLSVLGLLAGATPAAHATVFITTFPYTITGNGSEDIIISNPNHVKSPQVGIGPFAHVGGSITVKDDCTIDSVGHILNLNLYNHSVAKIEGGSVGVLKAHDGSYVSITNGLGTPVTLDGVEGYDSSLVAATGYALSPYVHSITVKYVYMGAQMNFNNVDVPNSVYTFGAAIPGFNYCTLGSVTCTGGSGVVLNTVYCTGDVLQYQAAEMDIANTTILGSVTSQGPSIWTSAWPNDPLHFQDGHKIVIHYNSVVVGNIYAKESAINIDGGTFSGGIYAMGGYINITGGHFQKGPFSGTTASGKAGIIVANGPNLVISKSGQLTGNLADGSAINVPCIGNVKTDD